MSEAERIVRQDSMSYNWQLADEEATQRLASSLARLCRVGDVILLRGEVGAGKTTFARAFIRAISPDQDEIVSPTFTLVQTYPAHDGNMVWHFDLYRLKHASELMEIGMEDALAGGITLIEWPDMASELLPDTALELMLFPGQAPHQRLLQISGSAHSWDSRLHALKEVL